MSKCFVVINFCENTSWARFVWKDIEKKGIILNSPINTNNRLLINLFKIHFSNVFNRKVSLPLKRIWSPFLSIDESMLDKEGDNIIIFHGNVKFPPSFLRKFKKKYNGKVVLYLADTVKCLKIGNNIKDVKSYMHRNLVDICYSFDKNDCKMYGFNYFDLYSQTESSFGTEINNYDLFYVGRARSDKRRDIISKLYANFNNKINLLFYVLDNKNKTNKYNIDKELPYFEIVRDIENSNCILELINDRQIGNTLRYKEAVVYNKKLLTNNSDIINQKYYNDKYMRLFSDIEEIDLSWVKEVDDEIDYKYTGDFSPIRLLELIQSNGEN